MKKKLVLLFLILAGAIIFLTVYLREKSEPGVIRVSGNIEVTEPNLGFKYPGRIIKLSVDEGDSVKKGDVLALQDPAELERQVSQNKALLKEAKEKLKQLIRGSRAQEIGQASADVSTIEAELIRLKKDYERADLLFKNGAISASQYDAAKSAYEAAASKHKSAGERFSLVKEGPRIEEIEAAKYRVKQAQAALGMAKERLKDTVLSAPMDGVILKKNVELGEMVSQGASVFTLGDLAHPWIKVYIKEDKMGFVKLGQKAEISVDSFPGKKYEGTVTYISSEAEFTPKNVQTQEERIKLVFGVKIRLQNSNDELKPGMPGDVKIEIQ